ncbi:hypothetical protein NC652_026763 [Populus alba x Populus x berolinensis]|nr:hypothetical protein NC652_026763 [Populus alba x Populus x berolinensis]
MDTCMIPIPNALTKKFWRLLREILSFSFTQGAGIFLDKKAFID